MRKVSVSGARRAWAALTIVGAVFTIAGCDVPDLRDLDEAHPRESSTPTTSSLTHQRSGSLARGLTLTPQEAITTLRAMPVSEPEPMDEYSREDFPHWRDASTWGWTLKLPEEECDTRAAVLIRDGTGVEVNEHCTVVVGEWVDPYSGSKVTDPSEVDGDHVVPLAAAWRAGANDWDEQTATEFANDPLNVVAADATVNSSKGDSGPQEWKPNRHAWCLYATRWIAVKHEYALNLTSQAEHDALTDMLATCPGQRRP